MILNTINLQNTSKNEPFALQKSRFTHLRYTIETFYYIFVRQKKKKTT